MNRGTTVARSVRLIIGTTCVLALCVAGCRSRSDDAKDKKIAELEQQLQAARNQGAAPAGQQGQPAQPASQPAATPEAAAAAQPSPAPVAEAAAAATPTPGASKSAPTRKQTAKPRPKGRAGVSADQYAKDQATAKETADQQRAANAQQAATNQQVQQQIADLKPIEVTLPAGTVIAARPSAPLSTDKLKDGATFEALLESDLVADGVVIAQKGAHLTGVVVSSDPGGRVKGVASLQVAARSIEGVKGSTIHLQTDNYGTKAATTKGKDATRTGILAGAGAVIGAIAGGGKGAAIGAGAGAAAGVGTSLATRGEAAVIPAETLIEFRLTAPVTVIVPR